MDWNEKKVLVNGVSGFIGSNITRELLNRGARVYSIDNFSYIDADIAKRKLDFLKNVHVIEGDVSKKESWAQVPRDIEYIFHFAAPSSVTLFKRDPERCYNETVFGFWNALEFAKNNSVKKVVWPSSGSNYAGNEMPHHEKVSLKPLNVYAAAKVACEALAHTYSTSVKILGLRIFGGYGPGEEWKRDFGSVIYLFIRDYMSGKAPEIWGDGSQTRDFIHINDVVKAAVRAAEIDYTGIVNVGTGQSTSYKKVLEIIMSSLGTNIDPVFIPKEPGYIENLKADTVLMKEVFGFEPRSSEAGIAEFVNYLRASS